MSQAATAADVATLRLCVVRLGRRIRQRLDVDLTPSQLSALATVERWGPLQMSELAARERITPSTLTRLVARLEQRGYIHRRQDPSDGRISIVAMTQAGRVILTASESRADAYLKGQLDVLTSQERAIIQAAVPVFEKMLAVKG